MHQARRSPPPHPALPPPPPPHAAALAAPKRRCRPLPRPTRRRSPLRRKTLTSISHDSHSTGRGAPIEPTAELSRFMWGFGGVPDGGRDASDKACARADGACYASPRRPCKTRVVGEARVFPVVQPRASSAGRRQERTVEDQQTALLVSQWGGGWRMPPQLQQAPHHVKLLRLSNMPPGWDDVTRHTIASD